jgi:DNA polymerase III alpha subunit (gram-positive type)
VDIYTNIINKQFNRELDRIIERLITVTNKIAQDVIQKAAESGFVVKSEWIEVKIGGRIVLVDPIISDGV